MDMYNRDNIIGIIGETTDEAFIQLEIDRLNDSHKLVLLRRLRTKILAQTDWRFFKDQTPSQEWVDYRQALRDIPGNIDLSTLEVSDDFTYLIGNIDWPVAPNK